MGNQSHPSLPADQVTPGDPRYQYGLSRPDPSVGITCEYDVSIPVRDGVVLKADVYRPDAPGKYPVIMGLAPFPRQDNAMFGVDDQGGTGTRLQLFEQPNPEFWIPRGYVYVTVSPRGFHGSGGAAAVMDAQEAQDFHDAIEWAAVQSWSDGSIGLLGISYYAFSQYKTAALRPPHLKAIIPWEGLADSYRDIAYRGGIPSLFGLSFGVLVDVQMQQKSERDGYLRMVRKHPLRDQLWADRSSPPDLESIEVPMLSVGNLNDIDLHLRGNVEAFQAASSPHKRLRLYSGTHWGSAYQPWALRVMLRFFDHWLKGRDTGLEKEPAVDVELRTGPGSFTHVYGDAWPLPQTRWTRLHLNAGTRTLHSGEATQEQAVKLGWGRTGGISRQVSFRTAPLPEDVAIAGPLSCRLWVSSTTRDTDITVEVRDLDERGESTMFAYYLHGAKDQPVTRGWLRASHRALDPERTLPHRPYHPHTVNEWLTPGKPVPLDIEIWPTSMLFKAGHRIELTVHAGRHLRSGETVLTPRRLPVPVRVPAYQTFTRYNGRTTVHTGGVHACWLDLPVIPAPTTPARQISVTAKGFVPAIGSGRLGDRFDWVNDSVGYHTSTEQSGLGLWDSQVLRGSGSHNPETWGTVLPWAGRFAYRDEIEGHTGSIEVPPQITSSEPGVAGVRIATAPAPAGTEFQVETRLGDRPWHRVDSALVAPEFKLPVEEQGQLSVRARLVRPDSDLATGWSPTATADVR
ncbi:CocE/NonD family hydrolase [Streptomyces sp. NPDC058867]|uniref:CocE/NonD family hydrolase n=1 Tax=unclassified Streptomyces TaxID=2593676 RepID=UPI0036AC5325